MLLRSSSSSNKVSAAASAFYRIYTRTGDRGRTSLNATTRLPKTDPVFATLGSSDELTSHIGVAIEHTRLDGRLELLTPKLIAVQSRIQDINSSLSKGDTEAAFDPKELETWIDEMDAQLPELRQFILPSGGMASAQLHVSRAVCRRAERAIQGLPAGTNASAKAYMNRLSDFLFVAARWCCRRVDSEERTYKQASSRQ